MRTAPGRALLVSTSPSLSRFRAAPPPCSRWFRFASGWRKAMEVSRGDGTKQVLRNWEEHAGFTRLGFYTHFHTPRTGNSLSPPHPTIHQRGIGSTEKRTQEGPESQIRNAIGLRCALVLQCEQPDALPRTTPLSLMTPSTNLQRLFRSSY